MRDKIFYVIITIICLIGITSIGCLLKYTIELSRDLSVTAYISNER